MEDLMKLYQARIDALMRENQEQFQKIQFLEAKIELYELTENY